MCVFFMLGLPLLDLDYNTLYLIWHEPFYIFPHIFDFVLFKCAYLHIESKG